MKAAILTAAVALMARSTTADMEGVQWRERAARAVTTSSSTAQPMLTEMVEVEVDRVVVSMSMGFEPPVIATELSEDETGTIQDAAAAEFLGKQKEIGGSVTADDIDSVIISQAVTEELILRVPFDFDLALQSPEEITALEESVLSNAVATGAFTLEDVAETILSQDPSTRARRADNAPINAKIVFKPDSVDPTAADSAMTAAISSGSFKVSVEINGETVSATITDVPVVESIPGDLVAEFVFKAAVEVDDFEPIPEGTVYVVEAVVAGVATSASPKAEDSLPAVATVVVVEIQVVPPPTPAPTPAPAPTNVNPKSPAADTPIVHNPEWPNRWGAKTVQATIPTPKPTRFAIKYPTEDPGAATDAAVPATDAPAPATGAPSFQGGSYGSFVPNFKNGNSDEIMTSIIAADPAISDDTEISVTLTSVEVGSVAEAEANVAAMSTYLKGLPAGEISSAFAVISYPDGKTETILLSIGGRARRWPVALNEASVRTRRDVGGTATVKTDYFLVFVADVFGTAREAVTPEMLTTDAAATQTGSVTSPVFVVDATRTAQVLDEGLPDCNDAGRGSNKLYDSDGETDAQKAGNSGKGSKKGGKKSGKGSKKGGKNGKATKKGKGSKKVKVSKKAGRARRTGACRSANYKGSRFGFSQNNANRVAQVGALAVGAAVTVLAAVAIVLRSSKGLQDATGVTAINNRFKYEYGAIPMHSADAVDSSEYSDVERDHTDNLEV